MRRVGRVFFAESDGVAKTRILFNADPDKQRHAINASDLRPGKNSFCRCWLSKTLPKCDGSHKQHNQATGDKVGPVVVMVPVEPTETGIGNKT